MESKMTYINNIVALSDIFSDMLEKEWVGCLI